MPEQGSALVEILVFASGLGGAKISRPAPHRTRGRGMKFRTRPALQRADPWMRTGAGDHLRGPARSAATGPRYFDPISRRKCEFPAYVKQ